jgi:hypothetical protein
MNKEKLYCGFCQREVKPEDTETGFLTFPDNSIKPVHLSHNGVKEEWEYQHKNN